MKNRKIYMILMCLSLSIACEQKSDWQLESDQDPQLVIEAILSDKPEVQTIKITRSAAGLNGPFSPVSGAEINFIHSGLLDMEFLESTDHPGVYESYDVLNTHVEPVILAIAIDGDTLIKNTGIGRVEPVQTFDYTLVDSLQELYRLDIPDFPFSLDEQAMFRISYDWSAVSDSLPNSAISYHYLFNSIHINELITPDKENIHIPKGTQVIIDKFGITDDFANYLKSILVETEWQGNFFYADPSSVEGNLTPYALGYFAVGESSSDTLIIE